MTLYQMSCVYREDAARFRTPSFCHVLHPLVQNRTYVAVSQGIKDGLSLPAVFDQLALLQGPELVRDGRLRHAQELGDVAHAHLGLKEDVQDLDAGGVAEKLEQLGQIVQDLLIRHVLIDLIDDLLMHVHVFAAFHIALIGGGHVRHSFLNI